MWMYLINQLHSGYFDKIIRVENVVNCLFVIDLCQFYCIFTLTLWWVSFFT